MTVIGRNEIRFGARPHARVVIYEPNADVLGSQWGHDVRDQPEAVSVLYGEATFPAADDDATWILSGTYPATLPPKAVVKIYNMVATSELLAWLEKQAPRTIDVILSDSLYGDLRGDDWFSWAGKHSANVKLIGGTGLYVPNWMP